MPADIYQASLPDAGLTPGPSPVAPTEGYAAMGQMANAGNILSFRLSQARDATVETQALTQIAQRHAEIYDPQKIAQDNDFSTMPQRFGQAWREASGDIVNQANSQLSGEGQARLAHAVAVATINGQGEVAKAAFAKEKSTNDANWLSASQNYQSAFVNATSDAGRDAARTLASNQATSLIQGGWWTPEEGAARLQAFNQQAEEAYIAKIQQTDPVRAKQMLSDPNNPYTKDIQQDRLVGMQNGAQEAIDKHGELQTEVLSKTNPTAAALAMGRIAPQDKVMANQVFDNHVIAIESAGNPNAVSPAGAAGIAQVMPGTARTMAAEMGLKDVAAMDDPTITAYMKANPDVNKEIGRRYWQQGFDHEGGSLLGTMAYYNAGPGNADRWMRAAQDKFGNNPTPQQFLSVVDNKETHDYIAKIYAHAGAPLDAYGMSPNGVLRGQNTVIDQARQEDRRFSRVGDGAAGSDVEQMAKNWQEGYPHDPVAWNQAKQDAETRASYGDPEGAKQARFMNRTENSAPFAAAAWQMPPGQVAGLSSQMDGQMRSGQLPATQANTDRLDALQGVLKKTEALRKTDPVGLGERQGLYRPVQVSASDIGSPGYADALATRNAQAAQSAAFNNAAPTPLHPDEASAHHDAFASMNPTQKAAMLGTAATSLTNPDVYKAYVKQVADGDPVAEGAGLIAARDPATAQKVLQGAEDLKQPGFKPKIEDVRQTLAAVMGPELYVSSKQNALAASTALPLYAANQAGNDAFFQKGDREGLQNALQQVTGPIVTINGRRTPITPGVAPGAASFALEHATAADFKPFGGLQPGMDAGFVGSKGQLLPLEFGGDRYQVQIGGRPVFDAGGRPLVVNLRDFVGRSVAAADRARAEKFLGVPDRSLPDNSPIAPQTLDNPTD